MIRKCGVLFLLVVVVLMTRPAAAAPIPIPNGSFETPAVTFVGIAIDNWTKAPQPVWWSDSGGYYWVQTVGTFANTSTGSSDHIFNMDGNQAAWLFGDPNVEMSQTLTAKYTVGQAYTLTVGVIGHGGGMLDSDTMQVGLYYVDGSGNKVPIGATTITSGNVADQGGTFLQDYSFVVPTVQATDAWKDKDIGVDLLSTADFTNMGGYWDVDNVRLTATPEPATLALLALGGALALRRRVRK